jgi:hypothetical protein
MSSISSNFTVQSYQPQGPGDVNQANDPNKAQDKNLTVTLNVGQTETGSPVAFTLSYPLIGIEDIPLNELMQQLQGLDMVQFEGLTLAQTVTKLDQAIMKIAEGILGMDKDTFLANKDQLAKTFEAIEDMANTASTFLYEMVSSGHYPDFADFLKEMLEVALVLRKTASDARQAAVKGEYQNIMSQAESMKTAAQERYDKAMEDVHAKRAEAIGQLIGAICSVAVSALGARFGGGFDGLQAVSGLANAANASGGAIGSLLAAEHNMKAAGHEKAANLLDAARKELEATQKLMQEAQNVANDIKEIAKQLQDMVLKIYQDFISAQNQIVQRANI